MSPKTLSSLSAILLSLVFSYVLGLAPRFDALDPTRNRLIMLGARKIKRANILLLADTGKPDFEIAELLHTSWLTVLRTRHRFVEGGLDFVLNELPRAGRLPKIDDKIETILTTLDQSHPPNGRVRWTLQLLAEKISWICTQSLINQPYQ